ncbi:ribosomal protein L13 [Calocera cornea HHB12733]|uniref:Ribosomal protein L13 n=1 Tax=Calocera cornea HHB12733 TaxID=1353952 RepID=A0A165IPW1_9BASI|nr:ribosomal protein L13 [Calocera cornea HHB12733]
MSHILGKTALATARLWHHVDAHGRVLGPLAANIAKVLMGKHKPIYDRGADVGDKVVVTNARHVRVTGNKADHILYRHHSGFPGGLKEIPYKIMQQKRPDKVRPALSGLVWSRLFALFLLLLLRLLQDAPPHRPLPSQSPALTPSPSQIIKLAVAGMLPKNKLRDRRLRRLIVYPGERNPSLRNLTRRWEDGQAPGHDLSHWASKRKGGPAPALPVGEAVGAEAAPAV